MVFNLSTVHDIYVFIDGFAPFKTAMDFDNPGLLVGSGGTAVKTALLSLDITPDVVDEAALLGAQLIISHHPVIFNPLKELVPGTAPFMLVKAGIAAVCAHTNLDMAPGGVNDCLAARLKLKNIKPLVLSQNSGLPEALYGETACAFEPDEFADFVKQSLSCGGLSYTDKGRPVRRRRRRHGLRCRRARLPGFCHRGKQTQHFNRRLQVRCNLCGCGPFLH